MCRLGVRDGKKGSLNLGCNEGFIGRATLLIFSFFFWCLKIVENYSPFYNYAKIWRK